MQEYAPGEEIPPTADYAGSNTERQRVGLPGHCKRCAAVGHVAAHPNFGCGDVGCDRAHPEPNPATAVVNVLARFADYLRLRLDRAEGGAGRTAGGSVELRLSGSTVSNLRAFLDGAERLAVLAAAADQPAPDASTEYGWGKGSNPPGSPCPTKECAVGDAAEHGARVWQRDVTYGPWQITT